MTLALVLAATAVVAAVACTPQPLVLADRPAAVGPGRCNAAAVRSCALPYPTDEWTVPDPTTATGRRVALPPDAIPANALAALGPGAKLDDVQAGADGFSAVGPVIFELDRPVEPWSIPSDGGDVVRVFDVATGAAAPIRVEVSIDSIRQGSLNTIVMAWPRTRWEPGHTYVARLRSGPVAMVAGPGGRSPGMDAPGSLSSIRDDLGRIEGDRWADTLSATRFTVRSSESATRRFDAAVAAARAADHPVRNIVVQPPLLVSDASAIVQGEVALSDFRDADGVVRADREPTVTWERFMLVLPSRPASAAGAPVVVYGHGLMVFKESLLVVASANAARGMATIGIDVPNHGDRQDEGGFLLDITTPGTLGRLASMPLQGEIDTVSLVSSIQNHLDDLDVATAGAVPDALALLLGAPPAGGPDGRPDLDTERLLYEGTSMGGVLGAAALTAVPQLDGAFLQVPGSGIADILYHSQLWPLFAGVVPDGLSAGDAAALEGAVTLLLDHADNTNFLTRLRDSRFPLFLQYGTGDGVVPNFSTERMMALADIPLVGEEITPLVLPAERTGSAAIPQDGRGAVQVYPLHSSAETAGFMAHLSFSESEAITALDAWLVNRLEAMGLTPR